MKCPHLNCLVYHQDGVCNCGMEQFCSECKKDNEIEMTPKKYYCHHYDYLPYKDSDLLEPCRYCKDNKKIN